MDMPTCDFKPEPYAGKSYEFHMETRKSIMSPALMAYYKKPVLIHQGYMQWLWDHTGRRYLDLFAGIVTVSVGHCHPKVVGKLQDQLNRLWHTTCIYVTPPMQEYAEKLVSTMPGNLKVVYLTNSGSEANDLAMLMARLHTGAYEIVSLRNAYHGASPSTMGLTALSSWSYPTPLRMGIHQTMNPDVYRGPWGGSNCRDSKLQAQRSCSCAPGECQASDMYAEQLLDVLKFSCPKKVAGFFAEGVQGVGGSVQLPKGYLKKAYQYVRERGGVCISDEVQTGFGRCGDNFWGFQDQGIMPDIVTMAKGIGNGFPLGAVVTTPEIAQSMTSALHFNTYGGNPLACTVGSAVLDVLEEDGLQANAKIVGDVFSKGLEELRNDFDIVGDVRGKGLMFGIEMVQDKESKTPLPPEKMADVFELTKENGILVGKGGLYGHVFRIKPPMCVTEEDAKFAISALRKSFQQFTESNK
jgi:alanine-glyoxylate transaminase/(R)-3-amino-2-methylpropionate-pyruvate transaminase